MFLMGGSLSPAMTAGEERMETPEDVAVMLRLAELGWGSKRIAAELGCSRTTVKRYLRQGGWASYRGRGRPSALAGLEGWLAERFRRHRGNADVVRQELAREHGVRVSLRTVERAVADLRRDLLAEARAAATDRLWLDLCADRRRGDAGPPVRGDAGVLAPWFRCGVSARAATSL